jgi:AraC-like DNA-binding protein
LVAVHWETNRNSVSDLLLDVNRKQPREQGSYNAADKLNCDMLLRHDAFRRLCRARELLVAIPEERLSIERIAREIGISPFHFTRQFEALFGATPHQFRIGSRIDRAKVLLAQGEHSVTEVCFEVGFESLGTFSDLFARRVGSRPSEYQRSARIMIVSPGVLPPALFPSCLGLMASLPRSAFRSFQEASISALR